MKPKQKSSSNTAPPPSPPTESEPSAHSGWTGRILLALLALYCIVAALYLWRNAESYQNDLKLYIAAAKAFNQGLNPYQKENLARLSGGKVNNAYHYPAAALYCFKPLAALDAATAARVFLGLKLAALASLIGLWRFFFFRGQGGPLFYFLCLLAFNGAIYIDLCAGNISLFEQLALWSGFAFLLRRRFVPFAALIIAAALFKLTPAAFLALPLLLDGRAAWRRCAAAGGVFAALLALTTFATPFGPDFWTLAGEKITMGRGILAPSTYALAQELCAIVNAGTGVNLATWAPQALYLAAAAVIVFFSWRAWRRGGGADGQATLMLACLVYALVLPRVKDYGYILLIPPAFDMLMRLRRKGAPNLVPVVLLAYPMIGMFRLPGLSAVPGLLFNYYPWVMAVTVWWIYLGIVGERNREEVSEGSVATKRSP